MAQPYVKRVVLLIAIMAVVGLVVGAATVTLLYRAAVDEQANRLAAAAKGQARLIEAVARFDAAHSVDDHPLGPKGATLEQVREAFSGYDGFGVSGESTVATRKDDRIVFLIQRHNSDPLAIESVPVDSDLAEGMRRALDGHSGTLIALDYRSVEVLAAHEPIPELGLGLVVKIDLEEIRRPFVTATMWSAAFGLLVVIVGSGISLWISEPLVLRLAESEAELARRVAAQTEEATHTNVWLMREVENRRRAEEKARQGEWRYREMVETLHEGIWIIDADAITTFANPRMAEMLGTTVEEMVGRHLFSFMEEPKIETMKERLARRRAGLTDAYEFEFRRADGSKLVASLQSTPMKDAAGNYAGAIAGVTDITDRLRLEAEQTRVFELPSSLIMVADRDSTIVRISAGWRNLLGYEPEEMVGRSFEGFMHPDDIAPSRKITSVWTGDEAAFHLENRFRHRDGSYRTLVWAANHDPETGLNYGLAHDITEHRALQERLQHSQKMEAIGTLAGGIAHDFNNILASILGYAELSEGMVDDERLRSNLNEILGAGRRARSLVRQILAFSRQAEQEIKPVLVTEILAESMQLLRATIPSNIEIRVDAPDHLDPVLGDPTQLHQIVMNLCTNAAHAMRQDGGVLEVQLSVEELSADDVGDHPDLVPGPHVHIRVADSGCGMEPRIMELIFDPYFTTKEIGEGTGLGLAVVQGIVQSHGGGIRVSSEAGEGTVFDVFLPQTVQQIELDGAVQESSPEGQECVLVVDDEPSLAGLLKLMLEGLGYRVTTSTRSEEALELVRADPSAFDLMITDMTMPVLTGDRLTREVLAIRPDLPVILCTGFSERITEADTGDLGVQAFIMKPASRNDLATTVRRVLDA